jgi:acetolactate synthase I/II/III large subunit
VSRSDYHEVRAQTTVSACVLDYLALEGVTRLFGIPGAGVKNILDELKKRRNQFEYVICRQETGAAYIADGYARVSGGVGVVLVTSGPGATNALTGAMSAQSNNISMLVITGEVPLASFGKGYVQEGIDSKLNVDAIYSNASQYSAVVTSPSNFQTLFAQALRDARSKPTRTSHISIPEDIAELTLENVVFPKTPMNYRAVPACADPERTRQAFDLLAAAERPLFFLGSGCMGALAEGDRLARFLHMVERYAFPVISSADGKGVFPESHRLALRNRRLQLAAILPGPKRARPEPAEGLRRPHCPGLEPRRVRDLQLEPDADSRRADHSGRPRSGGHRADVPDCAGDRRRGWEGSRRPDRLQRGRGA